MSKFDFGEGFSTGDNVTNFGVHSFVIAFGGCFDFSIPVSFAALCCAKTFVAPELRAQKTNPKHIHHAAVLSLL